MISLLLATPLLLLVQGDDVVRVDEWPALEREVTQQVKTDVQRLRRARTEEMVTQAVEGLTSIGPGAAPLLLTALGKEKDEEARGRVLAVLGDVTGAPHTRLLARSFSDRSVNVRTFALRRAATFPDPGTRAEAEAALEKAHTPGRRAEVDPDEVAAAALAVTASGSLAGLDDLVARAMEHWKDDGAAILLAGRSVRGAQACEALLPLLGSRDRREVVAGLRMLGGCGTKEHAARRAGALLDSDDTGVRIAAINALRGILDDAPPIERLSAFDSIELAKEWKRRLP